MNQLDGIVLCVDDEIIVQLSLQECLSQVYKSVYSADDADSGFDMIKYIYKTHRQFPNYIITDYHMPEKSGVEFLSMVKEYAGNEYGNIGKCILSGCTMDINGIELPSSDIRIISKPHDFDNLVKIINEYV